MSTGKYKQVRFAANALQMPIPSVIAVGSLYPALLFHFCHLCEATSTKSLGREAFVEEKHQDHQFLSGDSLLYSFYFISLSERLRLGENGSSYSLEQHYPSMLTVLQINEITTTSCTRTGKNGLSKHFFKKLFQ